MNISVAAATTPATSPAGHEKSCLQCGSRYRARRATSRYCSSRCVKRGQRGTPPVSIGAPSGIRSWLFKKGFAGPVAGGGYDFTVPIGLILAELSAAADRIRARGLRSVAPATEAELRSALRAACLTV